MRAPACTHPVGRTASRSAAAGRAGGRSLRRRLLVGAVASLGFIAVFGAPIASADPGAPLQVRAIDTSGEQTTIDAVYRGSEDPKSVKVTIDGREEQVASVRSFAEAGVTSDAVVVLDNSAATHNGPVQIAKEQLPALMPDSGGVFSQVGLVTVGGGASIVSRPVTTAAALTRTLGDVVSTGGGAIWDGVALAGDLFESSPRNQHHLILVVGSRDAGSANRLSDVTGRMQSLGVAVHVITLEGATTDATQLEDLLRHQGGSSTTSSPDALGKVFTGIVEETTDQYRIAVAAKGETGRRNSLVVELGDESVEASFIPGSRMVGASTIAPIVDDSNLLATVFGHPVVKFLIVVLAMGAVTAGVYAVALLISGRRSELAEQLRHYDEHYLAEPEEDEQAHAGIATHDLLKRAVEVTGKVAQDRGFLEKVERMLERADLPLRPAEALFFYIAVVVVAVLLSFVVIGNLWLSLAAILVSFILPGFAVDFLAKRRKKKFVRLLPDMLQLLSGTLRAGYSIGQGIEAVSQEVSEPMGKELRRVVTEARLGRPMEEALEAVGERMDSEDFAWAVMAIKIQREVGGNLAELLMTVADTMTQRERLRRDVAALTAEGRISAIVLGLLPPGLGVVMMMMNPDYISRLFEGEGLFMMGGAVIAMLVGFAWMKKCITIEI